MTREKYTPEGLPVISEGVINTFHRDTLRRIEEKTRDKWKITPRSLNEINRSTLDHMERHNNALYELYHRYDSKRINHENDEDHIDAENLHFHQAGFLAMYKLFLNQAEVNALE